MDNTERETQDFMNVDSFSQLPFIRPAPSLPPKEKGAIRLFGKDFGSTDHHQDSDFTREGEAANKDTTGGDHTEASSRKFECHYCCRNFPTSQALGGHQNAHKRERQQAKRAHLQSAMVHDAHVYGLMNYSRLGPSPPALPMSYHSWHNSNTPYSGNSRLFLSHSSYNANQPHPINGSPLALWRAPGAHTSSSLYPHDRPHHQIPLFNSKDELNPLSSISSSPGSQFWTGYMPKSTMQDHVSLDLHL